MAWASCAVWCAPTCSAPLQASHQAQYCHSHMQSEVVFASTGAPTTLLLHQTDLPQACVSEQAGARTAANKDATAQVGIAMVGMSSVLNGEGSSTHPVSTQQMLTGMALIVASQVHLTSMPHSRQCCPLYVRVLCGCICFTSCASCCTWRCAQQIPVFGARSLHVCLTFSFATSPQIAWLHPFSASLLSLSLHTCGVWDVGQARTVVLQAVQAGQLTFEDFFMADMNVAPLKIVGVEGLFGSLIMLLLVLPVVQFLPGADGKGLHVDSLDTLDVRRCVQALL